MSHPFVIMLLGAALFGLILVWRLLPAHRRRLQGTLLEGPLPLPPEGKRAWVSGAVQIAEPLAAPLTGRACVYWRVVIELWQGGPVGKIQRFRLWQACDFDVQTKHGRVGVVADGMEFETADDALRTPENPPGGPIALGRVIEDLLTKRGYAWDPQGLSSVLAREAILAASARVEVCGKVRHEIAVEGVTGGEGLAYREAPKRPVLVQPGVVRSLERAPADLAAEIIADDPNQGPAVS